FIVRCSMKKAINPGQQVQLVKDWLRHAGDGDGILLPAQQERRVRRLECNPQPERHHGQRTLTQYHQAIRENAIGDLKADRNTNLVSYPYYASHTHEGDIDMDI